jgi:hypothetical protein
VVDSYLFSGFSGFQKAAIPFFHKNYKKNKKSDFFVDKPFRGCIIKGVYLDSKLINFAYGGMTMNFRKKPILALVLLFVTGITLGSVKE